MVTVVTVRWRSSPPARVDERLVVADDGSAVLDVLRPRTAREVAGRFAGAVSDDEVHRLSAAGAAVHLDVLRADPVTADIGVLAVEVADRLRSTPLAAARFGAQPIASGDQVVIALSVVGHGTQPAELELEVASCALHFSAAGVSLSWVPLPDLPMGLVSAGGDDLGGVRRRAVLAPGVLGAIVLAVGLPAGADRVSAQLAGRWWLPGAELFEEFEVLTPPTGAGPGGRVSG